MPRLKGSPRPDNSESDTSSDSADKRKKSVETWLKNTILRLKIFTLGMAVMCPVFLIVYLSETLRQLGSERWPSVGGTVVDVIVKPRLNDKKQTMYVGRVSYTYNVGGKQYTTDLGPGTKRLDVNDALNDVRQYQPGARVSVFYDPNDPSIGILEKGVPASRLYLMAGLAIASVVCWIASPFIIRTWLKSRKTEPAT
jgi:Protein of unknown function (DUF3592)